MSWSEMPFGKYVGKTLPQILLRDLDYFSWLQPKLYGPLASEARDLRRKATSIRIPDRKGNRRLVQFNFEEGGPPAKSCAIGQRFIGFVLVIADSINVDAKWSTRRSYLDLLLTCRSNSYDKRAGRLMIRDFRRYFFGANSRMTKDSCEAFFNDESNFVNRRSGPLRGSGARPSGVDQS